MARSGRSCCSTAVTTTSLVVLTLLQAVIISGIYAEETITCSSGFCVPSYLCNGNGTVITDGDGLIDTRNGAEECPRGMVCCREEDSNEICGGTCVAEGACEAVGINLRVGGGCSFGEICCEKPLNRCSGTCTAVSQCEDNGRVDLRIEDQLCPGGQICCEKPKTSPICRGQCVAANECARSSSNSVDLRVQTNDGCPGDRICCENLSTCDGQCVSRGQCGDDSKDIDLRVGDQSCPVNQVCCKNLRTCRCVDPAKCPQMINLRFSNECPFHQVCCDSVPETNCNGLCTSVDQCEVRSNGTCTNGQTCCEKMKSSCDGTCVARGQCPTQVVDLRLSSDGSCPSNQICCKDGSKLCAGSCVSQEQCADTGFDLRISAQTCPGNAVCCKNLKKSPNEKVCQERCVPASQCPSNNVDLRFSEGLCPLNLICCPASKSCSGTCVTGNRCLDNALSINLRSGTESCPAGLVCCQNVSQGSTCDGQCTSRDRCADSALGINLRLAVQSCPLDQICCKNPVSDTECTCISLDRCADDQRSVDLRTGSQKCPASQTCCSKIKIPDKCDGSCVPNQDCPDIGNATSVDLRLFSGGCPANQVCCKYRCDGVCIPFGQCSDGSLGINLRNEDRTCPRNLQCCKNPSNTAKSTCGGKCLPREQCPFINLIDLRVGEDDCPASQVCCNLQQDPFSVPPLDGPNQAPKQDQSPSNDPQCDLNIDPVSATLSKAEVPWLVTVWSRREYLGVRRNQYECSGTLLAPDLILTSADCGSGLIAEQAYVRVGDFNLKPIETLSRRREYQVSKIETHPDYDGRANYANVVTLRLAKNSTSKSSICLARTSDDHPNSSCFLIGWNKQDLTNDSVPNALPSKILLQSTVAGCPQGSICSDRTSAVDQCDDFQGSPLICNNGQHWKQSGIVSRTQCDDLGVPVSFTALSLHWSWIQEQIEPSFVQVVKPTEPSRMYLPAKV